MLSYKASTRLVPKARAARVLNHFKRSYSKGIKCSNVDVHFLVDQLFNKLKNPPKTCNKIKQSLSLQICLASSLITIE